jgi:tripartite ATP-independent transporter DctM subunit
MSFDTLLATEPVRSERPAGSPKAALLHRGENSLVAAALAAMVVLPLLEIVSRKFRTGIPASMSIVQHLTLVVGMLGGAIAAREARLLSLSTLTSHLQGRWKKAAQFFSGSVAAAITTVLCLASVQFVLQEREAGNVLVKGVPYWVVEMILPLGFAVIVTRLLWLTSETWFGRTLAVLLVCGILCLGAWPPLAAEKLVPVMLGALFVAMLFGSPIFVTLGGAALILFWGQERPLTVLPIEHYRLVINPTLPTIPLFTLAGYFLAEGGASKRLVRVFQALVGQFRGGPAIATACICALFTSFTGGSGVTILALGGLLMPVLISARYTERDALGLVTGAGALGMLLPPCLPVILYAIIAKVDIRQMFLGGLIPSLVLIVMTAAWGMWAGRRAAGSRQRFDLREACRAVWSAKWELLLPVVALVALFSGWATPVEAAAITAFYAFFVEVIIYRDLAIWKDCPRVMTEAGLLVGGILLILGVALGFTSYLTDAQVPENLAQWAIVHVKSKWLFLLGLNLLLLVVGGVVEIYAAIIVVVPLLVPLGLKMGLDPIHLGIIFLANMELGFLAPPVGLNLLLSSYRFKKPVGEVIRAVLPMLLVLFIGLMLITYFPALTTFLPRLLK